MNSVISKTSERAALQWLAAVCLFAATVAFSQTTIAQQSEPSREPILRIETGMHTVSIHRIAVDAANRFLVTASGDKTIRVWELASGRLLRIIRVPIGAGNEGKLYGVAISPDGSTIAAGGWTGFTWHQAGSIYIFDRASGRVLRRMGGLPNVVNQVLYSQDGRYLAAALNGEFGIRVFSTADYAPAGQDSDYADSCNGLDFDHADRLVTTSRDGFIRLYATGSDGSLRLLTKRSTLAEARDVKFSPDDSRIVVGFERSTKVEVRQASDLASLYAPDTTDFTDGDLSCVAWAADGRTLYAGGKVRDANGQALIRVWADGGRGRHQDIAGVAANTIEHILALRRGGIVYGTGEPSVGVIDSGGKRQLYLSGTNADYRALPQGLLMSPDGTGIGFAYLPQGKWPARFSLTDRRLDAAPSGNVNWRSPQTEDNDIHVTEWENSYTPKLNGKLLTLKQGEFSRSLAFAPDKRTFLLGTSFSLRLFDRSGAERWRIEVPDEAWALNISADGAVAVAAYGDGTIRWYRMTDGKELLAFFPHGDRKRWVLWTPSGYYDASPGAEDIVGWHVNNGEDQVADFFPLGQFRSSYYRPDVVAGVLKTRDEARALQLANEEAGRKQQQASITQQLPPVVEIISPTDNSEVSATDVTVRFRVRTPSGEPVTSVKALVDGRGMGARQLVQGAPTSNADGTRELRVTVPERDSVIGVIAENRFTSSVQATVRVKYRAKVGRPDAVVVKPKLYILAVGVSHYADSNFNLKFAEKDAGDFVKAMMAQKDLLYRDVVVKLLTNEKATKDDVLDGLDWIRQETTFNDVAMVFFAGHGVNDQNNYYYFCPYNMDPTKLLRTGVAFSDIRKAVSAIAGKALFFVDSCHSGNAIGLGARRGPLDINIVINELSSAESGVVVFSASTSSESSYEREEWNNGAFTKALVEGLGGAASIGNTGRITYSMLNVYISERVKELTKGQQHPTMISPYTVSDFPIAVKH